MPNGRQVLNELEFERSISNLKDRELLEFVARQNYDTIAKLDKHNTRIAALENDSKRISGIFGGVAGTITAAVIAVINYFARS